MTQSAEFYMVQAQRNCGHMLKVPAAGAEGGTLCIGCASDAARQYAHHMESKFVLNRDDEDRPDPSGDHPLEWALR